MKLDLQKKVEYISNNLGLAFGSFNLDSYNSTCFQELLSIVTDKESKPDFNYAIYTDNLQVNSNLFLPVFHIYYLNSDPKDIIIMDKLAIDVPQAYSHHRYYVYNNQELFDELIEKYPDKITHIQSIKDIYNVPATE